MCGALKWQQSQQRATGGNGGIDRSPRDSNDQSPSVDLYWAVDRGFGGADLASFR
jgi:hypothetical protein